MFLNSKSLQNSSSLKSDIPCVGVLSDRDTGGGGSPDERPLLGELEEHLPVAEGVQRLALGAEGLVCHLREAGQLSQSSDHRSLGWSGTRCGLAETVISK